MAHNQIYFKTRKTWFFLGFLSYQKPGFLNFALDWKY